MQRKVGGGAARRRGTGAGCHQPDQGSSYRRHRLNMTLLQYPQPDFEGASVHVGDVSREVWRTNWPDTIPTDTNFDLGTLED